MEKDINPFLTIVYIDKHYFCDRVTELKNLRMNIKNGLW